MIREIIPSKKIIWVPGNHCFWSNKPLNISYEEMLDNFKFWEKMVEQYSIISGLNKSITIDGKLFFLTPWMYKTDSTIKKVYIKHGKLHQTA